MLSPDSDVDFLDFFHYSIKYIYVSFRLDADVAFDGAERIVEGRLDRRGVDVGRPGRNDFDGRRDDGKVF